MLPIKVLNEWFNEPWAILILIVLIFGVLALGVFLLSKFVINKKDKDEKPDEKTIADENLRIRIRSLNSKTYMDLSVNNNVIFQGLRCDANIDMTESFKYKGVKGALIFDTESTSDVYYTGFGSDYKLYYIVN